MPIGKLETLRAEFVERLDALATQAQAAPAGGGGDWGGVLHEHGVEPMAHTGAEQAVACGFQPTRGALPVELRKVFVAVREAFARRTAALTEQLRADGAPANVLHQLGKLGGEMDAIVDERMAAYVESIRPATTLGGIFANAAASSLRVAQVQSGTTTKKCKCCGAARLEGTDMRECAFCGMPLFDDRTTGDENEH